MPAQSASEDFSDIPNALGVPYTYWGIGGIDERLYRKEADAGRLGQDVPVNHPPVFVPVMQPPSTPGRKPSWSRRWPGLPAEVSADP
jgi:hypothetical protein